MSGNPSEPRAAAAPAASSAAGLPPVAGQAGAGAGTAPVDQPAARPSLRLSNVYATCWRPTGPATDATPAAERLRLGRLAAYYTLSAGQLPKILAREVLDPARLGFARWAQPDCVTGAYAWLLVTPSRQVVAVLSVDVDCGLRALVPLLEDGYYAAITVDQTPLAAWLAGLADLEIPDDGQTLLPEGHQLLFAPVGAGQAPPDHDTVQRLVYRSDLPYRPEHSAIDYPAELNRRPTTLAAVGPYVSVLAGQQDYLENALLLSAVQLVAAGAQLRTIRGVAYDTVAWLRDTTTATMPAAARRQRLRELAEQLAELELELSFGVEAAADLGMLIPALRVDSYHRTLAGAIDLEHRAGLVARMLDRLARAVAAEHAAIETLERRADETNRLRWAVAVGFVTTIAAPLGLLLAFFGINAPEVDPTRGMLDPRYWWVYGLLGLLVAAGIGLFTGVGVYMRRQTGKPGHPLRGHRRRRRRLQPAGALPPGSSGPVR